MKKIRITKAHIICSLLAEKGPMTKAELLQETARIEGKPYKADSNGSYFQPYKAQRPYHDVGYNPSDKSLVGNGTIKVCGKKGNSLVYTNTPRGLSLAAQYKTHKV